MKKSLIRGGTLAVVLTLLLVTSALTRAVRAGAILPTLGTAGSFGVLGASTVTNTGPTIISGDLGVSPGTAVTGFPPGIVLGTIHAADAVALQAQTDASTAYNFAAGQPCDVDLTGQDLGGLTLTSGVYCFSSSAQLTGQLTLDGQGNPNSVWIFQIGSTLITASGSDVLLMNGAQPCNIFWQVGSSATLGTTTTFAGNILALTSITLTTGAANRGGLYALNGAVTLDSNVITQAQCGGPTPSATSTPPNTATNTPTNTPTFTRTNTPTGSTATVARTQSSTRTRTNTRTHTPTRTFTGTRTNTPTRAATGTSTNTPTPDCSLCKLYFADANISCNPDGTVHWDGTVRNNQKVCSFPASYSVQLQSRVGYSGVWQTIARFDGAGTFPPGDTVLQGNFCYGTRNTDLVFYRTYILLNGPTLRCKAESISPFIDACVHPTACALFAPLPVGR